MGEKKEWTSEELLKLAKDLVKVLIKKEEANDRLERFHTGEIMEIQGE